MSQTVKTFVIFDTETTGLPSPGNNPRITELSFIALLRDELMTKSRAPRVFNKLLLCFNPQRKISYESSLLTGLYNDALEAYGPFKSHASLICSFLTTLPQPTCLIAHNGNRFDFPLIIAELNNAKQPVPLNILCVDSLEGFRELDGLPRQPEFVINKRKNQTLAPVIATSIREASEEAIDPDTFDSASPSKQTRLPEEVQQLWSKEAATPQYSSTASVSHGPGAKSKQREIVRNEGSDKARRSLFTGGPCGDDFDKSETDSSPDHSNILTLSTNKLNNLADVPGCDTPLSQDTFSPLSASGEAEYIHAAELAELNFTTECGGATTQVQAPQETPKGIFNGNSGQGCQKSIYSSSNVNNNRQKNLSYSLPTLYQRIFGQQPKDSHTAEDDCKTLLSIIQVSGERFCQWCDKNAEPLRNFNPMY